MYVAVSGAGKAKVIQFRVDTRIPGTKKKRTKVVKTLGNYERMIAEDPNIIEKLRAEARRITEQQKAERAPLQLTVASQEITRSTELTPSYHFGHALIKQLWELMDLGPFFTRICGKRNVRSLERALYYLLAHRCGDPSSILAASGDQCSYAGIVPVKLDTLYTVLGVLAASKESLVSHLSEFFSRKTARDTEHAFYDVTTYAFESTRWGELRLFGFSKDHKHHEVQVVMGLLIDNNGIPVTYELFPGNTMDQNTLTDSVNQLKALYGMEKITVVADRGLNSGSNLVYLCTQGYGFVISYTLKKSKDEFKDLVFDDTGWEYRYDPKNTEEVYKSKVVQQHLEVKIALSETEREAFRKQKKRGRIAKYRKEEIPVQVHVSWCAKRAAKDRRDRERILMRLKKRLEHPSRVKAAIKRGGNQYLAFDIDAEDCRIDEQKVQEAERYDGYYAVITNELDLSTDEVNAIYRGLWKIEDSFRILKTDLQARPVFVWNDDHVRGHFTLCYLCLCLIRYLQYLMSTAQNQELTAETIMEAIHQPLALVQGEFPMNIVTPTRVPQTYLDIAEALNLPNLFTNMTLTKFRVCTKLDLSVNLK